MSAQLLLANHEQATYDLCRPGHYRYPAPAAALADGPPPCLAVFVPAVFVGQVPVAASADALQLEEGHGPVQAAWAVRYSAAAAGGVPQVAPVEEVLRVVPVVASDEAPLVVLAEARLLVDVPAARVPFWEVLSCEPAELLQGV